MKKTNILLLALLALVCLFAVSCDSEPANPAKPDVTPPSETFVIDPVKDAELNVYQRIAEYLIDSGDSISETIQESSGVSKLFGDISGDSTSEEAENARLAFLGIAFSINGTFDYLGDDEPYIEIGGTKCYEFYGAEDGEFEIKNPSLGSFSVVLDEVAETRTVTIKDLVYDIEISSPVVHTMHVNMSAEFEFEVYYDEEDGEWYSSEDGSYSGSLTLNGKTWDSIEYDAEKAEYRYGEYDRSLWCTVKFDSKGGTPVETQRVLIGESADEPDTPKKNGNFIFKEWRNVKDDEPYDFDEIYEDTELYATYYTPAPAELEGEIYATYKLADYFSFVGWGGVDSFGNFFESGFDSNAALLDIAFLVNGKTSGFGEEAVITIGEEEYTSAMVKSVISDGTLKSRDGSNSLKSDKDDEVVGKIRYFEGLSYAVTVKSKDDNSIVETLNVSLSFGRVDVKPCEDPAYLKVKVCIDDGAGKILDRSLELFEDDEYGYYSNDDGDYYFDSTKYPKIELKK